MNRICMGVSVVSVAAISTCGYAVDHTKDSPAEMKKAVSDGKAILIDVREVDEWMDGHLKDAKHLPLSELKMGISAEKLKTLIPADKIVYLHCAAGGRCLKAAELLKSVGYETRPLKPGYQDLLKAGLVKAD